MERSMLVRSSEGEYGICWSGLTDGAGTACCARACGATVRTAAATAAKHFISMRISCASHPTWTRRELALVCGERRRRIVRKLLLFLVRALDGDVVEENRRHDRCLRHRRHGLR